MKDNQGRWRTLSLFWEYRNENYNPIYTLKEEDKEVKGEVFRSLKRLYLQIADPTEYLFAEQCLGGWNHWQKLCNNQMVRPYIDKWRVELDIKLKAQAIRSVIGIASDEKNKGQLSAAKYLAEKGWEPKRGRPTKEEVVRQQKVHAGVIDELEEDLLRVTGNTAH